MPNPNPYAPRITQPPRLGRLKVALVSAALVALALAAGLLLVGCAPACVLGLSERNSIATWGDQVERGTLSDADYQYLVRGRMDLVKVRCERWRKGEK